MSYPRTGAHTRACTQVGADREADNDTDTSDDDEPFVREACTNNTSAPQSMPTTPARALPLAHACRTSGRPPPCTPDGRECTAVTPSSSRRKRGGPRVEADRSFFIVAPRETIRTVMQEGVVAVANRGLKYGAGAALMFVYEDPRAPIERLGV